MNRARDAAPACRRAVRGGAADAATMRSLAELNREYEQRFDHIYLVCAAGRSADQLADIRRERLGNDPQTEWQVVRSELQKINRIRLRDLLGGTG